MKFVFYIICICIFHVNELKCMQRGTSYSGTSGSLASKYSTPSSPASSMKTTAQTSTYEPLFSWHQIRYENIPSGDQVVYPMEANSASSYSRSKTSRPQQQTLSGEDFNQYNNVPMGVTRWKNKVFITMPRRRPGIPATLNYINLDTPRNSNVDVPLIPYPNLETNRLEGAGRLGDVRLVSVYRTTADECNRLWMVDTGLLEYPGNPQQVQPPAIVIFDLKTGQIIHRYQLPESVYRNTSTLASIAVDVTKPGSCDNTFAYIPDLAAYGIIVYDMKRQESWRFSHNYFHNDPLGGDFNLNNELQFQWDDGIFSIALSPVGKDGFRKAYFHAMASTQHFVGSTRVLRNQSNTARPSHEMDFIHLGDKGERQQTSMTALDQRTGVLFFNQVHINGLSCWNTNKPFNRNNYFILFQDNERFIYPSDATVDQEGNLWVMTNTMPYFIYRNLNPENINFRVWKFNIEQLIANTNCAK